MPLFASQIDTSKISIKGLVAESSASAPASPVGGQMWTDTASGNVPKYWTGAAWVRMNGADIPNGTITDVMIAAGAGIALSKLATNPLARASHTGTQLAATISDFDTAVRLSRLDQMSAPTAAVNLNGQRATGAAAGVNPSDLVTKQQLDDARAGIAGVKDPVRVATQTNVNLASPGAAIEGVTMVAGDRFLAAGQTTASQNGIQVWNGAAVPATRAPDADAAGEILDGTLVAVSEGPGAGGQYIQTATPSGAPGSWTQTWVVYTTGGTSYVAGAGLVLAGTTFNIVAADGSIVVNGDDITVGLVPVTKGGTGATTAAQARTNLGALTSYSAALGALTAGVAATVTHNLNTEDVEVVVRETTGGKRRVILDDGVIDTNSVGVTAHVAYGSGALRVTVMARG